MTIVVVTILTNGFSVVPAVEVHPLADQLNGWLGTELLQGGHIQIINEEYEVFAQWRSKHTLTSKTQKWQCYFVYDVI